MATDRKPQLQSRKESTVATVYPTRYEVSAESGRVGLVRIGEHPDGHGMTSAALFWLDTADALRIADAIRQVAADD